MDLRALHDCEPIEFESFASADEIDACQARLSPIWNAESAALRALPVGEDVVVPGFCVACARPSTFEIRLESGSAANWREGLRCRRCRLSQRQRAVIDAFARYAGHRDGDAIYIAEQASRAYRWFRKRYGNVIGSEFLGPQLRSGSFRWRRGRRLRHEDLTALSLPDRAVRQIVCMDVLEHVPDYRAALRECARVLVPGGTLVLTAPFRIVDRQTQVRAERRPDGTIVHHLPPEYHGDPLGGRGVLAFYRFGWDVVDTLHEVGFARAAVVVWWDVRRGYLGVPQSLLVAHA